MCGRIMRACHSDMLKACEITYSRKLHSLTELVSGGRSLNGKGPTCFRVDVWRKQHNNLPSMLIASLSSKAQALRHNGDT